MRVRIILIVPICVLLVACSDSVPSPTATTTSATNPLLTTPSPLASAASASSSPGDPTPESSPQPTLQEMSTPTRAVGSSATSAATLVPIPDGPLTIVALGDSLTEGDGDQPGEGGGYPVRLQKSINEVRPNSRIINLGKSGWDSEQMVEGRLPSALGANPTSPSSGSAATISGTTTVPTRRSRT